MTRRWVLLCGVALGVAEGQTALELAKPVEDNFSAGETRSYQVTAKTGDFVHGKADSPVTGFLPDGAKIRSFADGEFRFVAEAPGGYRLDVKAKETGRHRIVIQEIQPMADRLHLGMPEGEHSPRITALQKELSAGHREALAKFWDDVAREGTPLSE